MTNRSSYSGRPPRPHGSEYHAGRRDGAEAARNRIVALLDRDEVVEAMTLAAFEEEEKARAYLDIKRTEWQSVGLLFQDNWRSRTRAACSALAEMITREGGTE